MKTINIEQLNHMKDLVNQITDSTDYTEDEVHMNSAVKIADFEKDVDAWYFYDRGSCIIGVMNEKEFEPLYSIEGTSIVDFTDELLNDCELLINVDSNI